MAVSIINVEDQANPQDFIIRKLTPNLYSIEESGVLLEVVDDNALLITTTVVDSLTKNPLNAKIKTKEYGYKTNGGISLKFFVKDGGLEIEQIA